MNESARIARLETEVKELRLGLVGLMDLMRDILETGKGIQDVRQLIHDEKPPVLELNGRNKS